MGKQSSGVLFGATTWTGNYEECFNVRSTTCQGDCHNKNLSPHFCSVHMTQAPWLSKLVSNLVSLLLLLVCSHWIRWERHFLRIVNAGDTCSCKYLNATLSFLTCDLKILIRFSFWSSFKQTSCLDDSFIELYTFYLHILKIFI